MTTEHPDTRVEIREYIDLQVQRLEEALAAEVELRRARREDDREMTRSERDHVDKRLTGMNELRAQIERERGNYATKDDLVSLADRVDVTLKPIEVFVTETRTRLSTIHDQREESRAGVGTTTQIVGAIVAVLVVGLAILNYSALHATTPTQSPQVVTVTTVVQDITPTEVNP